MSSINRMSKIQTKLFRFQTLSEILTVSNRTRFSSAKIRTVRISALCSICPQISPKIYKGAQNTGQPWIYVTNFKGQEEATPTAPLRRPLCYPRSVDMYQVKPSFASSNLQFKSLHLGQVSVGSSCPIYKAFSSKIKRFCQIWYLKMIYFKDSFKKDLCFSFSLVISGLWNYLLNCIFYYKIKGISVLEIVKSYIKCVRELYVLGSWFLI